MTSSSSSSSSSSSCSSPDGSPRAPAAAQELSSDAQKILDKLSSPSETSINLSYVELTEAEAERIGAAIASSKHLEELRLQLDSTMLRGDDVLQTKIILSKAFLGSQPNTSVRSLVVEGSGTDGDMFYIGVLPQVIRKSFHLTSLEFRLSGSDGISREDTRELFHALVQNVTIWRLVLLRLFSWDDDYIEEELFSLLVKLIVENTSITYLDVQVGRGPGSEDSNLPAFYRALQLNVTIKTLVLGWRFVTPSSESELLNWIQRTETLEELYLGELLDDYDEDYEEQPPLRYELFFQALQKNKGLRKLTVEGASVESEVSFSALLLAIKINVTLQIVSFHPRSRRPGRTEAVEEALRLKSIQPVVEVVDVTVKGDEVVICTDIRDTDLIISTDARNTVPTDDHVITDVRNTYLIIPTKTDDQGGTSTDDRNTIPATEQVIISTDTRSTTTTTEEVYISSDVRNTYSTNDQIYISVTLGPHEQRSFWTRCLRCCCLCD